MPEPSVQPSDQEGRRDIVNESIAYEPEDIRLKPVFVSIAGLIIAVVLAVAAMWLVFRTLAARKTGEALVSPIITQPGALVLPPEPRLQSGPGHEEDPQDELRQVFGTWEARLNTYGWVDRQAGIARIPIQESMRLMLATGAFTKPPDSAGHEHVSGSAPDRVDHSGAAGAPGQAPGQAAGTRNSTLERSP